MFRMSVDVSTPQLDAIAARLDSAGRERMHREIASELSETVRDHLRDYALSHHATAARLGARPTGHLEDANVEATSDADGATVTVRALGIRRALGPVEIRPRGKSALTIPVAAIAYGRSVGYLKARGVEIFRPKGKNYLATTEGKEVLPLYILAKRATLKHEPGLLPTRDTLAAHALEAAREYAMEAS